MNSQVRDAHWSLRGIWTRTSMISKVSNVFKIFDAALRTVSAAPLLSSCLSSFRDLWSRRPLASLRNVSCGSKYIKVSWSWQDGYQTESTKLKLCFESGRACQSNILHSRSRKVHRKIKHRLSWLGLLVLQSKVSGSKIPVAMSTLELVNLCIV